MDSMRSLNTSLPAAYSTRQPPPELLLQAFKTAALSVTNLYKSAITDQSNSRAAGYQDALDDLMKFLDRENLGLDDGEGWRVRQWVSERYDGTANRPQPDSEETKDESEQRAQSLPPSGHQPDAQSMQTNPVAIEDNAASEVPIPQSVEPVQHEPVFKFTAGTDENISLGSHSNSESNHTTSPIRVEVINRGSRTPHRGNQRHGTRSSARDLNPIAGTKRKLMFPDFFDITNIGSGNAEGPSKRGRLT